MRYFIGFIILLLLLYIYYHRPIPRGPIREYKDDLKTGDALIIMDYGFAAAGIRFYDGSPATHIAFVVVEDGRKYACELDWKTWFGYDVRIKPLDEFLDRHRPYIGVLRAKKELPITLDFVKSLKCKFDLTLSWARLPGRLTCVEFTHAVLNLFGAAPFTATPNTRLTPAQYYNHEKTEFYEIPIEEYKTLLL